MYQVPLQVSKLFVTFSPLDPYARLSLTKSTGFLV